MSYVYTCVNGESKELMVSEKKVRQCPRCCRAPAVAANVVHAGWYIRVTGHLKSQLTVVRRLLFSKFSAGVVDV